MKLLCENCGQEGYDHTYRELMTGKCFTQTIANKKSVFTATEIGRVNPEAFEDTGEVIDVRNYRPDFYVPERDQRLTDEAEEGARRRITFTRDRK